MGCALSRGENDVVDALAVFFEAVIRASLPLALAAYGELLSERAGFVNVGLEGAMIAGALAAAIGATVAGTVPGYVAGAAAGAVAGLVLAAFTIGLRTNQVLTGAAVTASSLGLTALLAHAWFGPSGAALNIPMSPPMVIPFLARVPVLGPALFSQPLITYVVFAMIPGAWWLLFRTKVGLLVRATGEHPAAVQSSGASPAALQALVVIGGSALGGLGGATLVLAQAGTFAEGMTAGRGFIALAVVALGRWRPAGVAGAALLFGATSSLQHLLQASGAAVPYQVFLALPYLLTLAVLAVTGRAHQPAWLGRSLP
jgi:simple sugar transport system permease protein